MGVWPDPQAIHWNQTVANKKDPSRLEESAFDWTPQPAFDRPYRSSMLSTIIVPRKCVYFGPGLTNGNGQSSCGCSRSRADSDDRKPETRARGLNNSLPWRDVQIFCLDSNHQVTRHSGNVSYGSRVFLQMNWTFHLGSIYLHYRRRCTYLCQVQSPVYCPSHIPRLPIIDWHY